MADKKQRYIPVGKKLIPVSEETYLYHTRWVGERTLSCPTRSPLRQQQLLQVQR